MVISDLNEHITCKLCAGYLIDATTVTECLHTFCRSCIAKYVQSNLRCPTCNVLIHETQPLHNLRPDRAIQDIVYKLVPGLYQRESERRELFYNERGIKDTTQNAALDKSKSAVEFNHVYFERDEELVCIELKPDQALVEGSVLESLSYPFLRCSHRVTVDHLKTFLMHKITIPPLYEVELTCKGYSLHKDNTLKWVWMHRWVRKESPMVLQYSLKEMN